MRAHLRRRLAEGSTIRRLLLISGLIAVLAAVELYGALADSEEGGANLVISKALALHPGDNYVGWVAEATSVEELLAAIPGAVVIYRWDAEEWLWRFAIRDVGGNLRTLEPGMAVTIRVAADRPVKWQRPLTPAKGMVTLYSGINWVAWNGREEWPLDQVVRGIGKSLASIELDGVVYAAPIDPSDAKLPVVRRGDALKVAVNRDLRWLQPTGIMSSVEWVGDIPQALKDSMTADIRDVVDHLAEIHGVEPYFSKTTVLIWHTVEDAVAYQDSSPPYPFPVSGEALRLHLGQFSNGGGTAWGAFVPTSWWRSDPRQSRFGTWLAHELFHWIQLQYTDHWAHGRPPEWLIEGTADWTGDVGVRIADGPLVTEAAIPADCSGICQRSHDHQAEGKIKAVKHDGAFLAGNARGGRPHTT